MNAYSRRQDSRGGDRVRRVARSVLAVTLLPLFAFSLAACDGDLFEVDNPTNILEEDLNDPDLADALGNTPETAVASGLDWAYVWSGAASDEGFLAGSGTFRIQLDEGIFSPDNNNTGSVYDDLASARWIADDATQKVIELVDDPSSDIRVANGHYWGGIARITLADHFEDVVYDGEAPITPRQAIQDAIDKFAQAAQVAQAAGDANMAAAAMGSAARGYRSLYFEELHHGAGEDPSLFQQAADMARQALGMRSDFIEYANYAPPGSENAIFNSVNQSRYNRMDPKYANQTDPVSGERDPRIKHGPNQGPSVRTGDPVFIIQKYVDENADIPVSRADEAHLIIAEYELEFGDPQEAVNHINTVRAGVGLPDFSSTSETEIREQLRYERIVEFWYEGRRWQDMRYYEIIPVRWADQSKAAGIHRRWPVSVTERNNNPAF